MSAKNIAYSIESKAIGMAGVFVIAILVLGVFQPAVKGGFYGDDFWLVARAARFDPVQYLTSYFNPTIQKMWYRPMHGVLLLVEYVIFRSNAAGYHLVQIFLHVVNCLFLLAIVKRLSRRWRLAFVSAILYTSIVPGSWAVNWITVHDPLAVMFQLATVWMWIVYLQTYSKRFYMLTFLGLLACLLSKESSVTLPVTLFLIDRLLIGGIIGIKRLAQRYFFIGLALLVYLVLEIEVQSHGYFPERLGYSLGIHIVDNLLRYLGLLVFPWGPDQWSSYLWFFTALALLLIVSRRRNYAYDMRVVLFLIVQALLTLGPVLPFLPSLFEPRYLYSTSIVSAVFLAILLETAWTGMQKTKLFHWSICVVIVVLLVLHSLSSAQTATDIVEYSRQSRVQLRDIVQAHPTFPPHTYLYFLNRCQQRITAGMIYLRYGPNVTVMCSDVEMGGVDWGEVEQNRFADLRAHLNSFVYYYDDDQKRHEVHVDPQSDSNSIPPLPVDFQVPIRLEGYELTSTTLRYESELVLLLYWKATGLIDKDYTVFVHLVDENGHMVTSTDSAPRNDSAPTTTWQKGKLIVDGHVLWITSDIPLGSRYRLEVGLYYLPTMERVGIVDGAGQVFADTLVIQPFSVVK